MVRAVSPGTNPQGIEMTITAQRATDAESQAGAEGSFLAQALGRSPSCPTWRAERIEDGSRRVSDALEGRVAIITGAARGQGAAEARMFIENGARVVLAEILQKKDKRWPTSSAMMPCSWSSTSLPKAGGLRWRRDGSPVSNSRRTCEQRRNRDVCPAH